MTKIIECVDLTKSYHDGSRDLHILQGVSLHVNAGEILAITGPSGVGKSTLLHILGTLDTPNSGTLYFNGKDVKKMGRGEVNRIRNNEIGFVFQFYHLLPEFNALENVMMPALAAGKTRKQCKARAEELLEKVGLTERMTHKPGQLSGGEQQRVAIARALFNEPSIVLSDEPTGNLDESTGAGVLNLLLELQRSEGLTLVIVTHDLQLATKADRWIVIHEGRAMEKAED
ncbi:MAG: ABC transporter ATP-binding protein [Candidatus Hydrogenedentes bacterium]|nr:ABC transporter ATP-binding protein [Candidatus Hydrogenedentota bacterium]